MEFLNAAYFRRYLFISLALTALPILVRIILPDAPYLADDAYYYIVVAQHIAADGQSSFYPGIATNGYHPLWLGLLSMVYAVGDPGLKFIVGLGIALSAATSFCVLCYLRPKTWIGSINTSILVWIPFRATSAFTGMESGLVLFLGTWGLLALFLTQRPGRRALWIATALLILATAARLDFAVFAIGALLLAPDYRLRQRLIALAVYAGFGLLYALVNILMFGTPLPISGAVKSLGGLQINWPFITQNLMPSSLTEFVIDATTMSSTTMIIGVALIGIALLAVRLSGKDKTADHRRIVRLGLVCGVGATLYFFKLFFNSSWIVWGWYGYVNGYLVLALLAIAFAGILPFGRHFQTRSATWAAALLTIPFYAAANSEVIERSDFIALNDQFIQEHGAELRGKKISMGDRAGSLAYFAPETAVFQLEGLVMDPAYLERLKQRRELTPYLCSHGVDLLIDYARPLANYDQHRVDALNTDVTQYRGAYVTVSQANERLAYRRNDIFSSSYAADNAIYLWALACGASPHG